MTTGLVLGKFAPLHLGHMHVMDRATNETENQVFVIYDSPQVTDVPLAVRSSWIGKLYPKAEVLEVWGGPSEVGYSDELMTAHEDFLLSVLRGREITHFFSSEEYGSHISERLSAQDVRVDQNRELVNVSATEIRKNLFGHRSLVHPVVYRDLIRKVVFLGAPSTGKSTIAAACADFFGTNFMAEYGREYWEANQINRRLTETELLDIALEHREREDKLILESRDVFFVDTDASTTAIFSDYYHQTISPELESAAKDCSSRYDLTFLCEPDIPYADTQDRSGEGNRHEFQNRIVDRLKAEKRPYIRLAGNLETRIQTVVQVLNTTANFTNPLDWRTNA